MNAEHAKALTEIARIASRDGVGELDRIAEEIRVCCAQGRYFGVFKCDHRDNVETTMRRLKEEGFIATYSGLTPCSEGYYSVYWG